MLAIFAFAVIAWITEAVSYEVSSVMIVAIIAILLGLAPDVAKPEAMIGTTKALGMALGGFASTALARVAAALVIAAAMTIARLDRQSRFAAAIMITVAQATSIWNIGIQTSAAQNVLAVGFMEKLLGQSVSWLEWLVAGVA